MSDKERNMLSADNESLDKGFRVEGSRSGEIDTAGVESLKGGDSSVDRISERASDVRVSHPDKRGDVSLEESQGDLLVDSAHQESAESRSSLVAELASHLSKPRSDFHQSAQFINRCRKRFRIARF